MLSVSSLILLSYVGRVLGIILSLYFGVCCFVFLFLSYRGGKMEALGNELIAGQKPRNEISRVNEEAFLNTKEISNSTVQSPDWINQWKEVKDLDFSIEHEHFFLERRYLDDFSKELISHAKSEVLIANPFILPCDLSNTLIEARRNGVKVQIITRRPHDNALPIYYVSKLLTWVM
jgi:hypothetical protein